MKTKVFLSIECVLYLLFIGLDCFFPRMGEISMGIKYIGIILCFFYVLFLLSKEVDKIDALVVRVALFFTLFADTCLIWLGNWEAGVASFVLVQICYFYRLNKGRTKTILVNVILFGIIHFIVNISIVEVPMVLILAEFYGVCLVRNTWDVFFVSQNRMFRVGLVLFLLCDVCVALRNLSMFVPVTNGMVELAVSVASVLIWVFYLPSQVAIALSVVRKNG